MKRFFLLTLLMGGVAFAQGSDEAYPGQSEHREPPKGWYCTPDAVQPAQRCACKNMPRDKNDPTCSTMEPEDDNACKVWCHKDHCACKIRCEESST